LSDSTPKLVLASHNRKKLRELDMILQPLGIELLGLADFPGSSAPEETGDTFEENAALKARYASDLTGLPSLADDSGLMVDALDGAPGVFSARFAGSDANDHANNQELLRQLANISLDQRHARFVSVVALALPGGEIRSWRGETEGQILKAERGSQGFGYDPLFLSNDLGKTFAEADDSEKNHVSHRGRALAKFVAALQKEHFL